MRCNAAASQEPCLEKGFEPRVGRVDRPRHLPQPLLPPCQGDPGFFLSGARTTQDGAGPAASMLFNFVRHFAAVGRGEGFDGLGREIQGGGRRRDEGEERGHHPCPM